jgi:hypothetical protein
MDEAEDAGRNSPKLTIVDKSFIKAESSIDLIAPKKGKKMKHKR